MYFKLKSWHEIAYFCSSFISLYVLLKNKYVNKIE